MDSYDPLSYENLARSVVGALMERAPGPLPPAQPFAGPGVYALYYHGPFEAYRAVASPGCERPIYVGKAIAPGARKGRGANEAGEGISLFPWLPEQPRSAEAMPLFQRLCEHAKSLEQTENLALADFRCRHLVVMPVWVTLAEHFLLSRYRPIWNSLVDGFGNHDPGSGRSAMRRPRWDILHPGRPWAARLAAAESPSEVLAAVEAFFKSGG
jgi:hypothetical protein